MTRPTVSEYLSNSLRGNPLGSENLLPLLVHEQAQSETTKMKRIAAHITASNRVRNAVVGGLGLLGLGSLSGLLGLYCLSSWSFSA